MAAGAERFARLAADDSEPPPVVVDGVAKPSRVLPSVILAILLAVALTTFGVARRIVAEQERRLLNERAVKPFDRTDVILRVKNLLETQTLYRRLEPKNVDLRAELEAQATAEREAAVERQRRAARIEAVLSDGVISMVFQPIVDIRSGAIVGAEALARFTTEPQRTPDVWFAEAAQVGRAAELELSAIRAATEQIGLLPEGVFLSLNASPSTAADDGLAESRSEHGR